MRCVRCDGLMVSEKIEDLRSIRLNGYEHIGLRWTSMQCRSWMSRQFGS